MSWKPISTFTLPTEVYEYGKARFLFYDKLHDHVVLGYCLKIDDDPDEWRFVYDRDGLYMDPTHWMEIPEVPK